MLITDTGYELSDINARCCIVNPWKVKGIRKQRSYHHNAQIVLAVKIKEVYSWAESIRNPDNIDELHNLRISVKRLRYSMELFAINYGETLKNLLKVLEDLQHLLGDIHDYDVIETVLTDYLQAPPTTGNTEINATGINALLCLYREMRAAKYNAFLQQWVALEESNFKDQLLKTITDENQ